MSIEDVKITGPNKRLYTPMGIWSSLSSFASEQMNEITIAAFESPENLETLGYKDVPRL